jgi:hypothetical protein
MKTLAAIAGISSVLSLCTWQDVPDFERAPCKEWALPAMAAGWPPQDVPRLLNIIWRESRCDPDAVRRNSRGAPIDVGLTQINQIHGPMLAERGFSHMDMTDPHANLWFARVLFEWWDSRGKCGWSPWSATDPGC